MASYLQGLFVLSYENLCDALGEKDRFRVGGCNPLLFCCRKLFLSSVAESLNGSSFSGNLPELDAFNDFPVRQNIGYRDD